MPRIAKTYAGTLKNGVITGTLDAKKLGTFDFTLE